MLHIYTAQQQPATNWVDNNFDPPMQRSLPPDALVYTECCRKKRTAKECVAQAYYDHTSFWCADGCGCKDPKVIAKREAIKFKNRSEGQKKRWSKIK